MNFERLRWGEWIAAIAGLELVLLVFRAWYEVSGTGASVTAMDAFDFEHLVFLAAGILAVLLLVLVAAERDDELSIPFGAVVGAVGLLATLLAAYRVASPPADGADATLGAYLGALAALGITVGGLLSAREASAGVAPATSAAAAPDAADAGLRTAPEDAGWSPAMPAAASEPAASGGFLGRLRGRRRGAGAAPAEEAPDTGGGFEERPAYGEVEDAPAYGEVEDAPAYGDEAPAYSDEAPSYTDDAPAYEAAEPAAYEQPDAHAEAAQAEVPPPPQTVPEPEPGPDAAAAPEPPVAAEPVTVPDPEAPAGDTDVAAAAQAPPEPEPEPAASAPAAADDRPPAVGDQVELQIAGGRFGVGTRGTVVDAFAGGVIVEMAGDDGVVERIDVPFEAVSVVDRA